MSAEKCLGGIGGILIDYILPLSEEEFLSAALPVERGSSRRIDVSLFTEILERLPIERLCHKIGGSVCNTLRHFAAFPGCSSRIFSAIGKENTSGDVLSALKENKMDTSALSILQDHTTDRCLAIVTPDGERTMLACIDAGEFVDAGKIPQASLEGLSLMHFEGYMMRFPSKIHTITMRIGNACGYSFDLASVDLVRSYRSAWHALLKNSQVRYLFGNLAEYRELFEQDSLQGIIASLKKRCHAGLQCIITDGANGATSVTCDGNTIHEPAFKISKVVNTIGAGDSFIAGYLSGVLNGRTISEALKTGARIAAQVVSGTGA